MTPATHKNATHKNATRKKPRRARLLPRQTQPSASRSEREPRPVAPGPPLREMPDCLKNRKPGDTLTNAQCVEVMRWMADCTRDIYRAAGLNV